MGLIEKVKGVLETTNDHVEGQQDSPAERNRDRAHLYRCSPCETTYISRELETCPECSSSLEDTPNEFDLGMS